MYAGIYLYSYESYTNILIKVFFYSYICFFPARFEQFRKPKAIAFVARILNRFDCAESGSVQTIDRSPRDAFCGQQVLGGFVVTAINQNARKSNDLHLLSWYTVIVYLWNLQRDTQYTYRFVRCLDEPYTIWWLFKFMMFYFTTLVLF